MAFFKIGRIGRTYRHMKRYRRILAVLFKYGFGDLIDTLKIEQYLEIGLQMISRKRRHKIETLTRAARVRLALEELGPTFIKLGQILSTRPDLLPMEFIQEFPKLQDHVAPFPYEQVKETIEKEFGKPVDELFSSFDEKPLAAASIGQVHEATLPDGEKAVVKIQRPDIQSTIEVDLEIMLHLAELLEKHVEGWDFQHPTRIVKEFTRTLEKELDYTLEAAHMERFSKMFEGEETLHVPKVYRELTTRRVLTMERIEGIKASSIDQIEKSGLDRRKIARQGLDLIMKQIFVLGFFHADPHPGNVFVLPDNVLCYIDFGMVGRLDLKTREGFADVIMAIARKDEAKATAALLTLTVSDEDVDRGSLERDVSEFMDQHCYRPLKEVDLGKLVQQLLEMASRHRLAVPPDLFLMMKALSTVEGLGRTLDPNLDVIDQAQPFIKRLQIERLSPIRMVGDLAHSGMDLFQLMREIPGEVREILKMARQGRIKIEFEHKGLEPLLLNHDRVTNRIVFAIVLASLVVGSSLIVHSALPPKWNGIPIIGLFGFVVAGAMGFWLLLSIMKHGRM